MKKLFGFIYALVFCMAMFFVVDNSKTAYTNSNNEIEFAGSEEGCIYSTSHNCLDENGDIWAYYKWGVIE